MQADVISKEPLPIGAPPQPLRGGREYRGGGEAPPSYTLVVIVEVKVNYSFYKTGYLNSGCGRNSSS